MEQPKDKDISDVTKLAEQVIGSLKKVEEFQNKIDSQMHSLVAKEKKTVKIKGKRASVSINAHGILFIEFEQKGEAQNFYDSLK